MAEKIDKKSYSFNDFSGTDSALETKGTSYFWLHYTENLR